MPCAVSNIHMPEGGSNTAHRLQILQKLARLFRVKRLTTRASTVESHLLDCLHDVNHFVNDSNLAHDGFLEDIYKKSRLVDLYHDMILEEDFFTQSRSYISHVMSGLMWVAIITPGNGFTATAKRLIERAPALWRHVWDNRSLLSLSPEADVPDGRSDNLMALLVAYGPSTLYGMSPKGIRSPDAPYLQHVSLYYLLKLSIDIDVSTPRGETLIAVLGSLRHTRSGLTRAALVQEAFAPDSGIEINALFCRFSQQLKRIAAEFENHLPGQTGGLKMHIDILSLLQELICQPLMIAMIGKHACHKEAVCILGRVIRGGISPDDAENTFTMWSICNQIYQNISAHVRETCSFSSVWRVLQELLRGEDVVQGLALGVEFISAHGSTIASLPAYPPQHEIARSISDVRELLSATRDTTDGKPLTEVIKRALRTEWWPALSALQKTAYRASSVAERGIYKEVMLEWMGLGHDVGLDGKKERKRHEQEAAQRCSWSACVWHRSTPGESAKLKVCQGCGDVRYCGRECQKSDWTKGGHRTKCRRLK